MGRSRGGFWEVRGKQADHGGQWGAVYSGETEAGTQPRSLRHLRLGKGGWDQGGVSERQTLGGLAVVLSWQLPGAVRDRGVPHTVPASRQLLGVLGWARRKCPWHGTLAHKLGRCGDWSPAVRVRVMKGKQCGALTGHLGDTEPLTCSPVPLLPFPLSPALSLLPFATQLMEASTKLVPFLFQCC